MRCGMCFAKYTLCLFNFFLFLAGGAIMGVGIWISVDRHSFLNFTAIVDQTGSLPQIREFGSPDVLSNISYIFITAGGFVFFLSFLGYCGAIGENRCLLGFYGFLLVAILILEATAASLAYTYKDNVERETKIFLKDTIKDYYPEDFDKSNSATSMWNYLMKKMLCCGVNNYTDFSISEKFKESNLKAPVACCKMNTTLSAFNLIDPDCPRNPRPENSYYLVGCYKTLTDLILGHMQFVIYVVVVMVLVELLAMFLAFCFCKMIEPYNK